jgi:hypothetical protein
MTLFKEAMKRPRNADLKKHPDDEYEGEEVEDEHEGCGMPMMDKPMTKSKGLKDFIEVIIKIGK